jgi:hypothetical protein
MTDSEFTSLSHLAEAINAATTDMLIREPAEIKAMRTGNIKIGTNGQYFSTWDIANGLLRDLAMSTWYSLLQTLEDQDFTLQQACTLMGRLDSHHSNYLRYSGFPQLGGFAAALLQLLPRAAIRDEAVEAVRAYVGYLNRMSAWAFHTFPWGLGKHFTYQPSEALMPAAVGYFSRISAWSFPWSTSKDLTYQAPEAPMPAAVDLSRRVKIASGPKVKLTWQPLNITVIAFLAGNENPEIVNDFLKVLPFTVMQDHGVVSGEIIFAWAPLVTTAQPRVLERLCDAPVGRLNFSHVTGQKVIINYGGVTEDLSLPVLGEILPEYKDQLVEVGRRVLRSTFETKEDITLTMELV